ncbi:alpha/beta hydrolase [Arsenicitalea aurantiaca]|uniref:Alpha/beta hydrolase n=2 Tax=Arsenicitalea aurantiaca TaxID=1783274 RepID=A0A433XM69_9HYPH|nr:alpha/beta hydrolase [Arsenicitalea aurantiaca]
MAPFNVGGAMDGGVVKIGDGIAYADGPRKRLDVYTPQNPSGSAPVVMFIYGGAWRSGAREDYTFVGHALAAAGFVVVIPDYRVYPEVTYPGFLEDNAQALRWVEDNVARFGGDPQRVFLAGHSAGAYNAVMLSLDHSFQREYGVTIPIRAVAGISGPYNFYPFEYNEVRQTFGSAPNPEGTQPVNLVTSAAPPMLLVTGTHDPIVRMQNTEVMAERLRAQGIWVTERYYEGFGHMEPVMAMGQLLRFRMPVLQDVVEFFTRFGAFPSGAPRPNFTPEPPEGVTTAEADPLVDVIERLDDVLAPLAD